MKGEHCNAKVEKVFEVDGKWVGVCCVPDEIFKLYPGWRKRVRAEKKSQ